MNRHEIHGQMQRLLHDLQEINHRMTTAEGKIPMVELDVFRLKAIALYDELNRLAMANRSGYTAPVVPDNKPPILDEELPGAIPPPSPGVVEMPSIQTNEEMVSPRFVPEMPYEIETEEEEEQEEQEEETIDPEEDRSKKPEVDSAPATVKTSQGELSLNEKLGKSNTPVDLVGKLKLGSLSDIREGMSQNQRFQFIANLFGNDFELFNHALNYINSATSKDDAFEFVNINIEKKYKWNDEDPLVNEFKTLILRRFM